jgi:DtxR family Mn-dependent transcriptional regulator
MALEQVEEYLETIYDIAGKDGLAKTTVIAKQLDVAPASVTESLRNLDKKGWVEYEPYVGAKLSAQGLEVVTRLKRRHRLIEVFLSDVLKIDPEKVHPEACRMEHYMSDETADALCRWLEAPSRSPHGKPISPCQKPVGDCESCRESNQESPVRSTGEQEMVQLTELEPDEAGTIAFIRGRRERVKKLSDLGLKLNTSVHMIGRPSMDDRVEVSVEGKRILISCGCSDNIFVRRT